MADYIRKQIDVDGSYVFPYTHADAVLYTTQNNLDGITSGTETNVKAVLDALDNTYRRLDSNITSLYNSQGKRGFLYLNGTTTTASMELPTLGNDFYIPTLKYDSNGNITTAWLTPASIAAMTDLSGYLPLTGGTLTGSLTVNSDITTTGKIMVGTGGTNSYLTSDSATNIYLRNSSGAILVCDGLAVRRGTTLTNATLGTSTYPWLSLYATTVYENGTSLASKYVTLSTDLSITGEKTFTGDKRIKFKQGTATDRLGFTLYDLNNKEMGGLELKPDAINSKPALTLFHYRGSVGYPTQQNYVGFRLYDKNANACYYLLTPLPEDAKTAITNLNLTDRALYFPLLFKYGSNTVLTSSAGVVDLTNLITGGGGSNITISSVLASSSSSTTAIAGDTLNPYYNVIVNSAVDSSIQFKGGTNITVTGDTSNGITFSNTLTNMSQLTNNLFINGTQTTTTSSWTGNLPSEITSLYDGLTIFYRISLTCSSSGASLQLYDSSGSTTIGNNCPVYASGTTRISNHYGAGTVVRLTYYNGEWRTSPYYYVNNAVTLNNSTSTDYRSLILGLQTNASYSSVPTSNTTNLVYKSANLVYSPGEGKLHLSGANSAMHGYYVRDVNNSSILGLCVSADGSERGLRDLTNNTWLCYCDDSDGETLKVPGTLIPSAINLAEHCQIEYDSTNQCINFTFI